MDHALLTAVDTASEIRVEMNLDHDEHEKEIKANRPQT